MIWSAHTIAECSFIITVVGTLVSAVHTSTHTKTTNIPSLSWLPPRLSDTLLSGGSRGEEGEERGECRVEQGERGGEEGGEGGRGGGEERE